MHLTEPMTMVTDYALGALNALWSVLLLRRARREGQRSVGCWGAGFAGFAVASIAGGTYHGFAPSIGATGLANLWTCVTVAMGLASFLMLCAAILAATAGGWRLALLAASLAKLAAFAIWVAGSDDYLLLILDYGSAQLAITALAGFDWIRERAASAPWLAAGVGLSFIGAAVQHSEFSLGANFNHNDVYHLIQMAGLYLLYRGGARFRDRT